MGQSMSLPYQDRFYSSLRRLNALTWFCNTV
jgi:hypothetical protein